MVERLNQELRRSLQAPELKQRFERDLFLSMDADVPTLDRIHRRGVEALDRVLPGTPGSSRSS